MVTTLQGIDLSMDCMMRVFPNLEDIDENMFKDAFGYRKYYSNCFSAEIKAKCSGVLQEFKEIYDEYCTHRVWSARYRALKKAAETGIVDKHVIRMCELHPNKAFVLEHFLHKPPKKLQIVGTGRRFNLMNVEKDFHALTHVKITTGFLADDDIKPLSFLGNLKFLDLSKNYFLSGKYISECRRVVALDLYSCEGINSFHMSEIAEALCLEQLSIMLCRKLTEERNSHIMNELFLNLDCLYQLGVDASIDKCIFPFIGGLMPKLKILNINTYKINLNELLRALANNLNIEAISIRDYLHGYELRSIDWNTISKIQRLKKLYIGSHNLKPFWNGALTPTPHLEELYLTHRLNISSESLITLYNACPKLNTWCIRDYRYVNEIFRIIKARRQQTMARFPLIFCIYNEFDFKAIINDKRYRSAAAAGLVDVRLTRDFPTPDWIKISPNVVE